LDDAKSAWSTRPHRAATLPVGRRPAVIRVAGEERREPPERSRGELTEKSNR
jgi:hypothetical protein